MFSSYIKDCNDEYDVFIEISTQDGSYHNYSQEIVTTSIEVEVPITNTTYLPQGDGSFYFDVYNLVTTAESFDIIIKVTDSEGQVYTQLEKIPLTRNEMVKTSDRVFSKINTWERNVSGTTGPLGPNGTINDNIFTYFCGEKVSKVELLAFYQEFLELEPSEICHLKQILSQSGSWNEFTYNFQWENEYCNILEDYWERYKTRNSGQHDHCDCKVINTRVFVNHSVGNNTFQLIDQPDCPDPGVIEGNEYWGQHGSGRYETNSSQNWVNMLYGFMGASKSFYTHTRQWGGGDEDRTMSRNLESNDLQSGLLFGMRCIDPTNATLDTTCICEKDIFVKANYVSRVTGGASTDGNIVSSGNGSVRNCQEDFALFSRLSKTGAERIQLRVAQNCVECESVDTVGFFTPAKDLVDGLGSIELPTNPGFNLETLSSILGIGETIEDLITDSPFFNKSNCFDQIDDTYILIDTLVNYTLTPSDNSVYFGITSYIGARVDFINDEARSDLQTISDYTLIGGLSSQGDSTCCNELVGAYAIGTLDNHQNNNLGHNKFDGLFQNGPTHNALERYQQDVALYLAFVDFAYIEDVFELPDCCTGQVNCYYNCGYWGDCHDQSNLVLPDKYLLNNYDLEEAISISPNPSNGSNSIFIDKPEEVLIENISILDMSGKLYQSSFSNNRLQLNKTFLPNVYIVRIKTNRGIVNKRLLIK